MRLPRRVRSALAVAAAAFGTGHLRRAQMAWVACAIGNWGVYIVLALYAYDVEGAAGVGIAGFARLAPAALAAPVMSVLADRHSRRNVLLACALGRASFVVAIAAAIALDAPFAAVLALALAFTVVTTAARPAHGALLPELSVTPQQLAAANSVWSAIDNAGFLAGALGGALLTAATSPEVAFAAAGVAFGAGAVALGSLPRDVPPPHRERIGGVSLTREALSGARAIADDRRLGVVVGLSTAMTLVEGCVDVLIVLTALEVLGTGDGGVGVLNSGWGVGGIAGGAVALALLRRGRLASGMSAGALLVAAAMIGIGVWPTVAGAVALLVAVGVGYTLVEVASATLLQRLASDEVLGRVFGVLETSYVAALGFGSLLAPALVALAGVRGALIVTGLGVVILVLITRHALAQLEAGIPVPEREYELLRAHGLFAPLPPAIVENLALRLRRVDVPAGGAVVREGEPGDRFYVVDSGSFEVLRDGARVALCEPGDCFGEIALLRDVPRQATVRALDDGRLVALERDDFLQSIGAHARSTSAAEALVVARGG